MMSDAADSSRKLDDIPAEMDELITLKNEMLSKLNKLEIAQLMARNRGHRNGARAGFLRNMAAKRSKEMYGRNKTK